MARSNILKPFRGSRSSLNTLLSGSSLQTGEILLINDEGRLAVATAANTVSEVANKTDLNWVYQTVAATGAAQDITLNVTVADAYQLFVHFNGLMAQPTVDYTVSGVTLSIVAGKATSGDTITVRYLAPTSALTPVDVFITLGESNTAGARNALTELPLRNAGASPYYATDTNVKIWDDAEIGGVGAAIRTLVPGAMEQQPGGASYVDPTYTNTVGALGEFVRHYRINNPAKTLYCFVNQQGGGRFTDAASRGRAANYKENLSNGAYNEMKVSWLAFKAALAADGKQPNIIGCSIELGANSAQDTTESNNFQSDLTSFLAQLRTDIIGQTSKVIIERIGELQKATWVIGNYNTVRAACATVVANEISAGRSAELLSSDAFPVVGVDTIHFSAAAQQARGELLYFITANRWHPLRTNAGATLAHGWRPGNLRNQITSGALQNTLDMTGNQWNPSQATAGNRPAIVSEVAMANGYVDKRSAQGNGTSKIVAETTGASMADGSYSVLMVLKGAAAAATTVVAEGGTTINPFLAFRNTAAGNMEIFHRNDAGTINQANITGATAFNNQINAIAVTDNGVTVQGYLNGTAGTPFSYSGGARGTTTTNRMSLFGLYYNTNTETQWSAAEIFEVLVVDSVVDSTYLSNFRAYAQYMYEAV